MKDAKISPEKDATFYLNCWQTFADTIFKLSGTVEKLQAENKALKEKIAKLSKNSSTSSKNPSSDDIPKPEKKKKTGRKIGGQPGHPKHTRPLYPIVPKFSWVLIFVIFHNSTL